MDTLEKKKAELEHLENRTHWHQEGLEKVEKLRNEVDAAEKKRPLNPVEKEQNKVEHQH